MSCLAHSLKNWFSKPWSPPASHTAAAVYSVTATMNHLIHVCLLMSRWRLVGSSSSFLACKSYDCVAPYIDIILHRGRFWAKSAASGSVRWCCFISCWTVLSDVMQGRPSCRLQSAGGEANSILLASALSSMRIYPNRVSRRDWIIAVSLGCFVSLSTSSFHTNWYHLMPSSIRRHHWSSASILRASVLDIAQQSKPYRNIGKMHVEIGWLVWKQKI